MKFKFVLCLDVCIYNKDEEEEEEIKVMKHGYGKNWVCSTRVRSEYAIYTYLWLKLGYVLGTIVTLMLIKHKDKKFAIFKCPITKPPV